MTFVQDLSQTRDADPATMDKETFARALRSTLEEQLTLNHPIFLELFKPEKNRELLKVISLEGYQITRYFLEYIENLHFRCPLPVHKRRLLFNMFEEETGRFSKTKNHVELMQDFIRAQGISDAERDEWTPSEATSELIDYRLRNCCSAETYHIGAAAVMIASEGQSLETRTGEDAAHLRQQAYASQPLHHLHDQQRVATQLEEVVIQAYLLPVQHVGPHANQQFFDFSARNNMLFH